MGSSISEELWKFFAQILPPDKMLLLLNRPLKQALYIHIGIWQQNFLNYANRLSLCRGIRSVAVDPSNEWFVTGSGDRTIKFWDLASGLLKLTLTGHIEQVTGLAISARQPYMFSCALDKMVKCWDLEYNKVCLKSSIHSSFFPFPYQAKEGSPFKMKTPTKLIKTSTKNEDSESRSRDTEFWIQSRNIFLFFTQKIASLTWSFCMHAQSL